MGLIAAALTSSLVVVASLFAGRPVNDDYWAFGSQQELGFWGSLAWYYTDFQGNVTSWFFILLHQQQWFSGLTWIASALSISISLSLLAFGVWGGLVSVGFRMPRGWRSGAALLSATVVVWLSLASLISPNTFTLVFYMPSTIVHVWPWVMALGALGMMRQAPEAGSRIVMALMLGGLAGSLGLVEGILIGFFTVFLLLLSRFTFLGSFKPRLVAGWVVGLGLGLTLQFASPATWGRSGGLGSEAALTTNLQAVERVFGVLDARVGSGLSTTLLGWVAEDVWARVLVPVAVAGDLLLRPGLIAIVVLASWWVFRYPGLYVKPEGFGSFMAAASTGTMLCAVGYALSGALYAYAGRHVAGLAVVVAVLAAGFGAWSSRWWVRRPRAHLLSLSVGLVLLIGLAVQQVSDGLERARAWDEALQINRELIADGRVDQLIDVDFKAGLSSSGVRDHGGSEAYILWVLSW